MDKKGKVTKLFPAQNKKTSEQKDLEMLLTDLQTKMEEQISNIERLEGEKKALEHDRNYFRSKSEKNADKLSDALRLIQKYQSESLTDSLTGLGNKRRFEQDMELHKDVRPGEEVAIIYFDIDNFKSINDKSGDHHLTGDRVLEKIGYIMLHQFRYGDVAYRIGGDEFIVVARVDDMRLHDTESQEEPTASAIANSAERVCDFIARYDWDLFSLPDITVSIGVALGTFGTPINELRQEAERALYRAKEQGKNQVAASTGLNRILSESN